MSNIPSELKYAETHEWVRDDGDGLVTIGLSDHAQTQLGDLVFVELPEVGTRLAVGTECGVVESVKAASDIYSPISGEVTEVNEALADTPEKINDDPYQDAWIFKAKLSDASELNNLMDAERYQEAIENEDH